MKRTVGVLMMVLLLGSASYAGGIVSFGLHLNGAETQVAGPLKDAYAIGIGGGGHVDFNALPIVGIRVSGDYISFSLDPDKAKNVYAGLNPGLSASSFGIDGGRLGILSFSVNGKVGLPSPLLSPYATAGFGIASVSRSKLTATYPGYVPLEVPESSTGMKSSLNLGAGVDLNLAVLSLYLEVKYMWIFGEETSTYAPVSIGVTF